MASGPLKPGEMADAIETAMEATWQAAYNQPLPAGGKNDRRVLFLAIARGMLTYLKDHQDDMVTSLDATVQSVSGNDIVFNVNNIGLNTDLAS